MMSTATKRGLLLISCLLLLFALVSGASADEYEFSVSQTEVNTEDQFTILFSYPGADQIELIGELNGEDYGYWFTQSNIIEEPFSCSLAGELTFHANVAVNGETIGLELDPSVQVYAPNGSLNDPGFNIPAEVPEGAGMIISYTPVNQDEWYDFWCDSNEGEGFDVGTDGVEFDETGYITISADLLSPGQVYRFHCAAHSTGYNYYQQDQSVMVNPTGAPQIDDEDTSLTIRPSATTINTFTDTAIAVYAPANGDVPTADAFEIYVDGKLDTHVDSEAGFRWWFSRAYPGDYVVSASAHYPGENDGFWTNPGDCQVTITVQNPKGNLPSPNVGVDDRAYVGDQLDVTFTYNKKATFYSFWVHKWDSDENCYWEGIDSSDVEAGKPVTLKLDTRWLESGVYYIECDINAAGYREGHTTLHLALLDRGDVDHSDGDNYYFTISSEGIRPREDLHVIYYVPGTWATRVYCNENEDLHEAPSSPGIDFWWSWGGTGEKTIYGQCKYIGSDEWSEPVELGTVTIDHPEGWLSAPNYSMPDVIASNEDLVITFTEPVDNADTYWYWYAEDQVGEYLGSESRSFLDDENPLFYGSFPFSFTIPAGTLEAGKVYRFYLDANRTGWVEGHTEHLVYVTGGESSGVTITGLPQSLNYGDTFTIQVGVPEGAQRLMVFANNECKYDDGIPADGTADVEISPRYPEDGSEGTVHIVAEALVDGNWIYESTTISHPEAAGILDAPDFSIPSVINADEDLVVTINGPTDHAEQYSYWYSLDDQNYTGEAFNWVQVSVDDISTFPYSFPAIPANTLQPGNLYRFRFDADAYTWVEGHAEQVIYVTSEDDSIEIGDPIPGARFNSEFYVPVSAPGADSIIVYVDGGGLQFDGDYAEVSCYFDRDPEGGSITLLAQAWIDGSWSHATSKVIEVPAAEGSLGQPALTALSPATVTRGDFVVATVSQVDNAEQYRVWFRPADDPYGWSGDYGTYAGDNTAQTYDIFIPTAELAAGSYTVHAYVTTEGWVNGDATADLNFTVADPTQQDPGSKFYIPASYSRYEQITGATIPWSAYAPWADAIRICVSDHPDDIYDRSKDDQNEYAYYVGNSASGDLSFDYGGTYYVYAVGHGLDDGHGKPFWDYLGPIDETAVRLDISTPNGDMPAPPCSLYRTDEKDGYEFSIDIPSQASNIDVWVEDATTRTDIFAEWRTYRSEFTFPDRDLTEGHIYVIHYTVWGFGYTPCHGNLSFMYGSQTSADLTLDVPEQITFAQGFDIQAYAPGASRIIIYVNGEQYESDGEYASCWYHPYRDDGSAGTVKVYAQACIDGDWNNAVGPVTRSFDAATGTLGAPTITMGSDSVVRGQFVTATLTKVTNAHDYRVYIYDENDKWYGDYNFYTDENDQNTYVIQIPTANLEPGTYDVHAYVTAAGYVNGESASDGSFTVSANSGSRLNIPESQRNLITGEHFDVSAYAPGADQIRFCVSSNPEDIHNPETYEENIFAEFEGDNVISSHWIDWTGTWYAYAIGHWHYEDDEGEHDYWDYLGNEGENAIELHVTSSGVTVSDPEWDIPNLATGDYSFSIYPNDDATDIDVTVTEVRTGRVVFEEYRTNSTTFTIPANQLINGRIYHVDFTVWGYNLEPFSYTHGFLYSTDDPMNHVNLRLPDQLTTIEAEAFSNLPPTVFYVPSTVTSIAESAFDDTYTVIIGEANSTIIEWAQNHDITYIEN